MKIISHRGYWKNFEDKNRVTAFERSFSNGFGTETDIRDFEGELVISHDIANETSLSLRRFFEIYKKLDMELPLALNIKSDGLQQKLLEITDELQITNFFVFDMSVPDMLGYKNAEISFFSRQSEYEAEPILSDYASGIWMDSFLGDWIQETDIQSHIEAGKQVCVVSPELHKRNNMGFWARLRKMNIVKSEKLMLCTDFPEDARGYFNG